MCECCPRSWAGNELQFRLNYFLAPYFLHRECISVLCPQKAQLPPMPGEQRRSLSWGRKPRQSYSQLKRRVLVVVSNANHNPISPQDIWATEADILKINMGPFHLRDVTVRQQILIQLMPLRVTGGV